MYQNYKVWCRRLKVDSDKIIPEGRWEEILNTYGLNPGSVLKIPLALAFRATGLSRPQALAAARVLARVLREEVQSGANLVALLRGEGLSQGEAELVSSAVAAAIHARQQEKDRPNLAHMIMNNVRQANRMRRENTIECYM